MTNKQLQGRLKYQNITAMYRNENTRRKAWYEVWHRNDTIASIRQYTTLSLCSNDIGSEYVVTF